MTFTWPSSAKAPGCRLCFKWTWILGIALLSTMPLRAAGIDSVALIESARMDKPDEVQKQLTDGGEAGLAYLRRYSQVFIPAVARFGNSNILNILIDAIGKNGLNEALDKSLVAAFDNPQANQMVEQLLNLGANPSAHALGHTALARAVFAHARRNDARAIDAIKLLLSKGANRDAVEDSGMSPLTWACSSGDDILVKLLLDQGAKPDKLTHEGRSMILTSGPACANLLNAEPGEKNAVNPPTIVQESDPLLIQALYQAVMTDDLEHAAELLKQGVSANFVTEETGQSLLMLTRSSQMASLLIANGADVELIDSKGWTVLNKLVTCPGTLKLVEVLLAAKANPQHYIENGQNTLLLTHLLFVDKLDAQDGRNILRLLVAAGVDINSSDREGETLLHLAAYNDAADLAQIALELGADVQRPNERGETPLDLAKRLQANKVLAILNKNSH